MESILIRGRHVRSACRLACNRARGKRDHDVAVSSKYDGPSVSQRHFIGVLAEFAAAEYFDLRVNSKTRPDPGYDFVVRVDGERVTLDVKGYTHERPRLLVEHGKVGADYYVLCRVNLAEYSVDCSRDGYRLSPNEIIRQRQRRAEDTDELARVSLTQQVVVDLLGFATKEMVLGAPVMRHKSSPSHTLRDEALLPLSELDAVQPSTSRRGWPSF